MHGCSTQARWEAGAGIEESWQCNILIKKNRKMTNTKSKVLPELYRTQRKGIRRFLRFTASHGNFIESPSPGITKMIQNIRLAEALSTFLDFLSAVRGKEELTQSPYDRLRNRGMASWRDDHQPIADPLVDYAVLSKKRKEPQIQAILKRLDADNLQPGIDPLLLKTSNPCCTEHQALQWFMDQHDPRLTRAQGTLALYTERFPCKACCGVFEQFIAKQPGVQLAVFYEYSYFRQADNETAVAMMKKYPGNLKILALKHHQH